MGDPAVEALLAKQAITEVLHRYCRGLDRMDRAMALSVWHPGGTADYGPMFQGTGAEFVDWVWKAHEAFVIHSHQIANVLIEVDLAADRATSESYVTVALRFPPRDGTVTDIIGRGRYADRWSRRDGVWAVDHRRYVDDLQATCTTPAAEPDGRTGRRGRDDPSYEALTGPLFG
jgi:hypothetical protein